jgi:hypothetical protein
MLADEMIRNLLSAMMFLLEKDELKFNDNIIYIYILIV